MCEIYVSRFLTFSRHLSYIQAYMQLYTIFAFCFLYFHLLDHVTRTLPRDSLEMEEANREPEGQQVSDRLLKDAHVRFVLLALYPWKVCLEIKINLFSFFSVLIMSENFFFQFCLPNIFNRYFHQRLTRKLFFFLHNMHVNHQILFQLLFFQKVQNRVFKIKKNYCIAISVNLLA